MENNEVNSKIDPERIKELSINLLITSRKVRSLRRAFKRGRLTPDGTLITRPFNNRANTSKRKGVHSRVMNEINKRDYELFKRKANKQSL